MRTGAARAAILACAAVSIGIGLPQTWHDLGREWARYEGLTAREAALVPARNEGLPVAALEAFRRAVRPSDRYVVEAPAGRRVGFANEGFVLRSFAAYWLLPAIPAATRADATVVLRYRGDAAYDVRRLRS